MTRRRWIADTWTDNSATLSGEQAIHLARVLRAQPGMEFDVVAGERVWHAVIVTASEDAVVFKLLTQLDAVDSLAVTVMLSIFKFDRLEWAIEKLTELGVSSIQPVSARRTEKHLAQAAVNRVERWQRIALESAKQSRRSSVIEICDPLSLKDGLNRFNADRSHRIVLAENEKQQTLRQALQASAESQPIVLAVGPEGGWAPEEEALFTQNGWTPASLGPTILRAETAAIAAVAITSAWLTG
jgi:16S rRNA (uracil1498-N3)-methyltransferase